MIGIHCAWKRNIAHLHLIDGHYLTNLSLLYDCYDLLPYQRPGIFITEQPATHIFVFKYMIQPDLLSSRMLRRRAPYNGTSRSILVLELCWFGYSLEAALFHLLRNLFVNRHAKVFDWWPALPKNYWSIIVRCEATGLGVPVLDMSNRWNECVGMRRMEISYTRTRSNFSHIYGKILLKYMQRSEWRMADSRHQ